MTNSKQHYVRTITTRISEDQYLHIKDNPSISIYLRSLIELDIQVVDHEKT